MNKAKIISIIKEVIIWGLVLLVVSNIISYLRKPQLKDDSLPSLTLETIEGKKINFEEYRGKPLLIHFWATWCPTCKLETANIDTVSKEYPVVTIAVNSGNDEQIREFMKSKEASFDVIHDRENRLAQDFSVEAFPTTFIYNTKGKLVFSEVGYTSTAGLLGRDFYLFLMVSSISSMMILVWGCVGIVLASTIL
jgi:thiol-disulfide isomerase/thioredoxin